MVRLFEGEIDFPEDVIAIRSRFSVDSRLVENGRRMNHDHDRIVGRVTLFDHWLSIGGATQQGELCKRLQTLAGSR